MQTVPFCGLDADCTISYYGNQRRKYPVNKVRLTTPTTSTYFQESYVWRENNGVLGNFDPLAGDTYDNNICQYKVYSTTGGSTSYFNITCEVINKGDAYSSQVAGGKKLAPNVGPGVQYIQEQAIGGPIVCPSPTPEVWCV